MLQTEGPSSWHRLVSDEQVEQKIDVGHSGVFNKQLRQIQRPGGFCLSVVRKRLVGGATRGPVVLVHGLAETATPGMSVVGLWPTGWLRRGGMFGT